MKYHFGCGPDILPGYINCDSYEWPGIDQMVNLTEPILNGPVEEVFSNAFFEHLFVEDRAAHLDKVYSALNHDGFLCYIGLPWFPGIAKAYMMKQPGTMGPVFDLYHAWRYTHGAPEEAGYSYMGQLHKGLFDQQEFNELFRIVNVESPISFTYTYPGEPDNVHVTAGFYLPADYMNRIEAIQDASDYLTQWDGKYLNHASLDFRPTP